MRQRAEKLRRQLRRRTWASLCTTSGVVATNVALGWGTRAALLPSLWALIVYNAYDTAAG